MKKNNYILIISTAMIVFALIGSFFLPTEMGARLTNIITIITAIVGAISLFIQFKKDKELNKANFLLEYNKTFYNDYELTDVYGALDKFACGKTDKFDFDKYSVDITKYLQWIESIASLVERGIIDFYIMDNLMSYRFFIITNNPIVQERELIPCNNYYRGVYYLYNNWFNYEKKRGIDIPLEKTALNKNKDYQKVLENINKITK